MAIQFTDFSKAPLLDSPAKTIFEDVLKGYQISQEPAKMQREAQAKELANQLAQYKVQEEPKRFRTEMDYKKALMDKARNALNGSDPKASGDIANQLFIDKLRQSNPEAADRLQKLLDVKTEHTTAGTDRSKVLTDTQEDRAPRSPIAKMHYELSQIDKGFLPGTKTKLSPAQQTKMRNDIMLGVVLKTTDPKIRDQLIKGSNMNITLDSINPQNLTQYSGAQGAVNKLADSIIEGAGEGSPEYKAYRREVIKANAAAKQLRQYLGDSIQPYAQDKLEKLMLPEAWNVSPKLAAENFEFMRDLFKRETQTLVRAATDPTLYTQQYGESQGSASSASSDNPATFNFTDYPVYQGGR